MKHPVTAMLDFVSWSLSRLSETAVQRLADWMGGFWWHVLRYRRRVILTNLSTAFPDSDPRARATLGRKATAHLARALLEFLRIPYYASRNFEGRVRFDGMENFERAKSEGKGVLCLSGHLGSFELAVAAVASRAKPVWLVVKPFPRAVDRFVTRVRTMSGLGVIPARRSIRGIIEALRRNEAVVFVLDQNATRSIGIFVDFFGRPACTFSALANLALRTRAPVIAATPYRDPDGTHVLRVLPAIPLEEKASEEETIAHMTQVYTRVIENAIREHPEQWFWTHKRWRTQPKE